MQTRWTRWLQLRRLQPLKLTGVLALVLACGGCGWMGGVFVDRSGEYLDARTGPRLTLPPDLTESAVEDVLVIPDLPPRSQAEMFASQPPRPRTLQSPEEAETIKIQMLGDEHWLVIPQPPALVWPQLVQFFLDSGVPIARESPSAGELETGWLDPDGAAPRDPVRTALAAARAEAGVAGGRDRLLIRLEQGLRERTSEVVIRHEHDPAEPATMPDIAEARRDLETLLLNEVGAYVAENVSEPAFSLQAAALANRGKAMVMHEADGMPVLRLELDFDRAWATVRQALIDADVDIRDLDRSGGQFYLGMTEQELTGEPRGGFFSRRWRREESHDLQLKMRAEDGGYVVGLYHADDTPVARDHGYNFLARLREFVS